MTKLVPVSLLCMFGCGGSTDGFSIVATAKTPVAGDAIALELQPPPASDLTVTWSMPATVAAISPDATDPDDPLPAPGAAPTGVFVTNPTRRDVATAIDGVLFVLDAGSTGGTIDVQAVVSGETAPITATLTIGGGPTGDATRGQAIYNANCATCHGATGDGSPANPDGSFTIDGNTYAFPAPGLNNAPGTGNLGGDPDWNAALLTFAVRADCDNGGITLRDPMPNWLSKPNAMSGAPLTTQDVADVYAYLAGETQ